MNTAKGKASARPEPIHRTAHKQQSGSKSQPEGKDDVGIVNLVPVQLGLQCRLEQTDHLAVHRVHRGGKKQQSTDDPAIMATNARSYRQPPCRLP